MPDGRTVDPTEAPHAPRPRADSSSVVSFTEPSSPVLLPARRLLTPVASTQAKGVRRLRSSFAVFESPEASGLGSPVRAGVNRMLVSFPNRQARQDRLRPLVHRRLIGPSFARGRRRREKGGPEVPQDRALGRSRGGFRSKVNLVVDLLVAVIEKILGHVEEIVHDRRSGLHGQPRAKDEDPVGQLRPTRFQSLPLFVPTARGRGPHPGACSPGSARPPRGPSRSAPCPRPASSRGSRPRPGRRRSRGAPCRRGA